jgi:hypothetical protein
MAEDRAPDEQPAAAEAEEPRPGDDVAAAHAPGRVRRRLAVIAAACALVVVAALVVSSVRGPDRHEEGQGELAVSGEDGTTTISDFARVESGPVTFGLPLCHLRGETPTLADVSATEAVGSGFRIVGTGVRTFVPAADHTPIFSVDGWPPDPTVVRDAISPVAGYTVASACTSGPPDGSPYTELLVAMQRTSADGGGWFGFEIGYTVAGRYRVLHSTWRYAICGTSVPCSGDDASPSP